MNDKVDTIIMSATRMSMFLSCKWKYYCNYILKLPRKPNTSFKLGISVHESLAVAGKIWKAKEVFSVEDLKKVTDIYNKIAAREGIEDPMIYHEGLRMVSNRLKNFASGKILTVEDRFNVTTPEGVILTGAMDRVEELEGGTLLVTDYKTSKYFETQDELKSDIQLSVYDVVAKIKYPDYSRIILSLDYLRGEPVFTYRTDSERAAFTDYMLAIYAEMLKFERENAVPQLNDMCNWCDFTDNCTAYQEALAGKSFFKKKPEEYSDEELVKEYLDLKSRKRVLDNREKQIKQYIMTKINADEKDVIAAGKKIFIRQNSSTLYDPKTVHDVIPTNEFLEMVSISKKDVDDYMTKHPYVKPRIMETAKKSFTSPFLSYKNIDNITASED